MNAPLMRSLAKTLAGSGFAVLRFNFRGVGESQGTWGGGTGEVLDVAAAVDAAEKAHPSLPLGIAGWSFGATTSLRWLIEHGASLPWAGVSPGIAPYRGSSPPDLTNLLPFPRLIVFGDRDQFATVAEMEEYASSAGASLEVIPGTDHFFVFRDQLVGRLIADHFDTAFGHASGQTV
jgi:alpha/beta superfamily hydrolase